MTKLTKRMARKVYTRQRVQDISYHEAGHVVAALGMGLGIQGGVKIATHYKGTRRYGLLQQWGGSVMTKRRGRKEDEALFVQAGIVAELHFNPRANTPEGWSHDQEMFMSLMEVEGQQYMNLWTALEGRTREFVISNWGCISALARAFIRQKHHSLSRLEILRVVGRTLEANE